MSQLYVKKKVKTWFVSRCLVWFRQFPGEPGPRVHQLFGAAPQAVCRLQYWNNTEVSREQIKKTWQMRYGPLRMLHLPTPNFLTKKNLANGVVLILQIFNVLKTIVLLYWPILSQNLLPYLWPEMYFYIHYFVLCCQEKMFSETFASRNFYEKISC